MVAAISGAAGPPTGGGDTPTLKESGRNSIFYSARYGQGEKSIYYYDVLVLICKFHHFVK